MGSTQSTIAQYPITHSGKCDLSDNDIADLIEHPWDNLESLWLSYNHIGPKGINHLISHKWPKLISLHLSTPFMTQAETSSTIKASKTSQKSNGQP